MQRCTSDIETIRRFLGVQLVEVGNALSLVILIGTIMLLADRRMALIAMAAVPVLFTSAAVFFRKVRRPSGKRMKRKRNSPQSCRKTSPASGW